MFTTRAAAAAAGIGLALSLSACSSSASVEDTNAAYCEGAAKVQSQLDELVTLIDNGAPTTAIKDQRDLVESAIQANSVPLSQLTNSVQTELEAANDAFNDAIEAIPEDAAPAEAASSYKAAVEAYEAAVAAVDSEVGCS